MAEVAPLSVPPSHIWVGILRGGPPGVRGEASSFGRQLRGASGGETEPTALHANLQAVGGLAAGIHDAAVQVAGQVTVGTLAGPAAAAAEAGVLGAAGAAGGAVQDDVAERQELTEQTGQDAVDAAICGQESEGLERVSPTELLKRLQFHIAPLVPRAPEANEASGDARFLYRHSNQANP